MDTSGVGIGAILSQAGVDGTERPVAYHLRKLKPTETRYAVTEQECLAVMEAEKHFWAYLCGAAFTIITDHSSLKYLASAKDKWTSSQMIIGPTTIHLWGTASTWTTE